MAVFALSGLWHGANWTYVIWGLVNGIFRVLQELLRHIVKPLEFCYASLYKVKKLLKILVTYILVCMSWVFFRANTLSDAGYVFKNILNGISLSAVFDDAYLIINENILDLHVVRWFIGITLLLSITAIAIFDLVRMKAKHKGSLSEDIIFTFPCSGLRRGVYLIMALMILWMFVMQNGIFGQAGSFIYFQF